MSTHNHIDYIEFPCTDFDAMKAFYGAAFGWTFQDWGPTYVAFEGAGLEGGFRKEDTAPPRGGAMVILYSTDLDASQASVEAAGGETTSHHEFPGGRRFQFLDPTGNELAVWIKAE
ncbi:MAG: VOC family protein [Planctomycetes bacterium]|nr:VOC family protein [Planctomycetota bacterium]